MRFYKHIQFHLNHVQHNNRATIKCMRIKKTTTTTAVNTSQSVRAREWANRKQNKTLWFYRSLRCLHFKVKQFGGSCLVDISSSTVAFGFSRSFVLAMCTGCRARGALSTTKYTSTRRPIECFGKYTTNKQTNEKETNIKSSRFSSGENSRIG